ncbi:MAG: hypothetical protein JWM80_6566 [Cyanobacteria bacterium RYN_339]|nr:hypothetical protein [Cyanobacteria bacterium RYN_339]
MFRKLPTMLVGLLAVGAFGGGLYWWELRQVPQPLSYADIQEKDDYERLINILLPTVKGVLERDGELPQPVAFGMEMNDHLDFLEPQGSSTLDSLSQIVHDFKFGAHAGQIRCTAIAYDVMRKDPGIPPYDALEFRFEHINGDAVKGWLSYKQVAPHKFQYGVIHFERMDRVIFSRHNVEYGDKD